MCALWGVDTFSSVKADFAAFSGTSVTAPGGLLLRGEQILGEPAGTGGGGRRAVAAVCVCVGGWGQHGWGENHRGMTARAPGHFDGSNHTVAGFLGGCAASGLECVPLMWASTGPIGTITADAFGRSAHCLPQPSGQGAAMTGCPPRLWAGSRAR